MKKLPAEFTATPAVMADAYKEDWARSENIEPNARRSGVATRSLGLANGRCHTLRTYSRMAGSGTSALSEAAFGLAAFGSVVATASLTWQVATFKLSGSRVKATLKVGGLNISGALTTPAKGDWRKMLRQFAQQGYGTACLAAEVTNVGRLGVDIVRCTAVFSNGMTFDPVSHLASPPRDTRLDHGQTKSWFVDLDPLQAAVDAAAAVGLKKPTGPQEVRLRAELGTGRSVVTLEAITIAPRG
jgi:hypothetical protein